jgi:hypothetical protein
LPRHHHIYFASPSDVLILEYAQDSQPHAIVDESTCSTIPVPLLQCIYVIALCVLIAFGSCLVPPYLMAALSSGCPSAVKTIRTYYVYLRMYKSHLGVCKFWVKSVGFTVYSTKKSGHPATQGRGYPSVARRFAFFSACRRNQTGPTHPQADLLLQ